METFYFLKIEIFALLPPSFIIERPHVLPYEVQINLVSPIPTSFVVK